LRLPPPPLAIEKNVLICNVKKIMLHFEHFSMCEPEMYLPSGPPLFGFRNVPLLFEIQPEPNSGTQIRVEPDRDLGRTCFRITDIGVGAQSTLEAGGKTFLPENICMQS